MRHFVCPSSKEELSIVLISPFCTQFHFFALNFTFLHSISLFCTDLGLIDMLLTNQNAEIVACVLLKTELDSNRFHYHCRSFLRNHLKIINITYSNQTYPYFYTENQASLLFWSIEDLRL